MQKNPFRRFQGMFMYSVVLVLMILITACASTSGSTRQPATGTATTTPSARQVPPTATQLPASTTAPVTFRAGGILFIGPVKSITSNSLVMGAPNGETFTITITPQTDLSAFGGSLPTAGTSVNMDASVNPDGSFAATILKPALSGDPDLNVIAYIGITTSPVGTDRVLHFTI